jgi:hypothetical protein
VSEKIESPDSPFFIKIGQARSGVEKRTMSFGTGNPRELEILRILPASKVTERFLHREFANHRVSPRREWFRAHEDILSFKGASNLLVSHVRYL